MKKTDLKKMIDKSDVVVLEDHETETRSVVITKLAREVHVETDNDDDARDQAYEMIVNEQPHLRGFEFDDESTPDNE